MLHIQPTVHRGGWSAGNAPDLNSESAWIGYRPGHCLFYYRGSPQSLQTNAHTTLRPTSFKILSSPSIILLFDIYGLAIDSALKLSTKT
jgi:hypothetical protein